MIAPSQITAVLLAGGRSRRMGRDKAFLSWESEGRPLWERQLEKLESLGPAECVLSARPEQEFPGQTIILDADPGGGPLPALATVFGRTSQPFLLPLAIDTPLVTADFLHTLLATAGEHGLVYRRADLFEPFPALYPRSLAPLLDECLAGGARSMQEFLSRAVERGLLESRSLPESDSALFKNLNTPEDLQAGMPNDSQSTQVQRETLTRDPASGALSRKSKTDRLATEQPLEIRVEGHSVAVVMRTPCHDEELAAGFLLTEGVARSRKDIFEISQCPSIESEIGENNVVEALLSKGTAFDLDALTRHVFSSSSCGICGKATIDSVFQSFNPIPSSGFTVAADTILSLPEKLRVTQATFEETGGLHASALFDRDGTLLITREDVGRHNALDKVIGNSLLDDKLPLSDHILLVSGRISFELVQKALAAGIPVIAGISAPSSLAVQFAEESNQTIVGFLRGNRMNVYTNPERIR